MHFSHGTPEDLARAQDTRFAFAPALIERPPPGRAATSLNPTARSTHGFRALGGGLETDCLAGHVGLEVRRETGKE